MAKKRLTGNSGHYPSIFIDAAQHVTNLQLWMLAPEVLSRQRPLSIGMIRKLHEGLGIPADVLIKEPSLQSSQVAEDGECKMTQGDARS